MAGANGAVQGNMTSRWLDPPVELVGITRDGTYHNYSLAAYIPVGATGVILRIAMLSGTDIETIKIRHPSTTYNGDGPVYTACHTEIIVGVNSSREIAISINAIYTDSLIYLVGFFGTEGVFFTEPTSLVGSMTCDSTWRTLDLSASIPAGAIAAIITDFNGATPTTYGWRGVGSTNNLIQNELCWQSRIVPLDANRQLQYYYSSAINTKVYLIGYLTSGISFNTNAVDRSTGTTGSYQDVAALPAGALGGYYHMISADFNTSGTLRKNGTSQDIYARLYYSHHFSVQCDTNRVVEQKINSNFVDLYELGYWNANPVGVGGSSSSRRPMLGVGI